MSNMLGKPRGYAFVTFKDSDAVKAVFEKADHIIDQKKVI